jgi:hypothetical protein
VVGFCDGGPCGSGEVGSAEIGAEAWGAVRLLEGVCDGEDFLKGLKGAFAGVCDGGVVGCAAGDEGVSDC